jgi:cob(I)alamin adenosyltransferase
MKVYTRRGDKGETDLFGGGRVTKSSLRVEAYGEVDELNSFVGAAAAATPHADVQSLLQKIQHTLFDIGACLATPEAARREKNQMSPATDDEIAELEQAIDRFEEELAPLKNFVLPGGTAAAASFHVARTVCRRAERRCVALANEEAIDDANLRYVNRLSDLLFVIARLENARADVPDVEWTGRG